MAHYEDGLQLLSNMAAVDKKRLDRELAKDLPITLMLLDGTKIILTIKDIEFLGELIEEMGRKVAWRVWRGYAQRAASFGLSIAQVEEIS